MTATQRHHRFNLVVIVIALALYLPAAAKFGFVNGTCFLSMLGLLGFGYFFYRRRGDEVVADERDRAIQQRAGLIAFGALWVLIVFGCVVASFLPGDRSIPVRVLPTFMYLFWALWQGTMSAIVLARYGRSPE
jgi:uncharacterized membrane protein